MRVLSVLLVLVLLGLQARLWFGPGSLPALWALERRLAQQQQDNAAQAARNRSLAAEVADLKDGLEAIEERARADMGMIGADEVFVQIVHPPRPGAP